MPAAVYARYSSENQRPESIDDQISACRKLAKQRSITGRSQPIRSIAIKRSPAPGRIARRCRR
jgi:hypothetical protein